MKSKSTKLKKWLLSGLTSVFATSLLGCGVEDIALTPYTPVGTSVAQSSARSVNRYNKPRTVPGQIIVKFRTQTTQTVISQMSNRYGLRAVKGSPMGAVLFAAAAIQNTPQIIQQLRKDPLVDYAEANAVYRNKFTVNDPRSADQRGLAMIGMAKAWDITQGDPRVTIAVVDTGVDLEHPDLKAKLVPGYDVINQGTTPPRDGNGHGTHASGIAAAITDNKVGIAGVAGRCKLMPVRALDDEGAGNGMDVATGVIWAVDHGANVINLSLGGPEPNETLERAIQYALMRNVPVVVAMGNESVGEARYPAASPGVIAVGSVDSTRTLSSFSNYGPWMTVVAPGSQIMSTMPTYGVYMTTTEGYRNDYDFMDGTSMAAPMVAGVVALIKSRHPQLTPAEIKARIEGTATDLGQPGYDPQFGHGVINAARAIL